MSRKPQKRKTRGPKRGRGQPSPYRVKYAERAHELYLAGMTDVQVAENLGVAESTLNLWKKRHPEFSESIRLGREAADGKVARALFLRAIGFKHQSVKIFNDNGSPMVVPYQEEYPPDTAAAVFWLKNRQRGKWNDRHELTGADGGPVRIQQLSDAELAAIIAAGGGGGGTLAPA